MRGAAVPTTGRGGVRGVREAAVPGAYRAIRRGHGGLLRGVFQPSVGEHGTGEATGAALIRIIAR